jgi:hypothetical protein
MDTAIEYIERTNSFVAAQLAAGFTSCQAVAGRKYDKVLVNDAVRYFIDKQDWTIYGAKSTVQHNTRRVYGTLSTQDQFDWFTAFPKTGTEAEAAWLAREAALAKNYKPRGRPKKVAP